jgi:hypothetical protein
MFKLALVLGAGYAGFRLAYQSEDGIHYGKVGDQTLRTGLSLFFAALSAGLTYAALLLP